MAANSRTNGFRVYEAEVMDVLDCISPNAERLYRKLFQRVNLKKDDGKTFPSWKTMQSDTGFQPTVLSRAIKELEHFRLISVERPEKVAQIQSHAHNVYFLTETTDLPKAEVLERLSSVWNERKAEMSAKEKARKAKYEKKTTNTDEIHEETEMDDQELLTQTEQATNTDIVELLTQTETNHDEYNKDEYNKEEENFEKNDLEESPIPVQEVIFSEEDQAIPVKNLFGADLEKTGGSCIQDDFPKWKEIEPIYNGTRGTEDERLMAVVANWRDADVERLRTVIWMGTHDILSEME